MQAREFTDNNGAKWRRVSKPAARRAFVEGAPVTICAVNMRPFGMWAPQATITADDAARWGFNTSDARAAYFDTTTDYHAVYACTCRETGLYPAFYVLQA